MTVAASGFRHRLQYGDGVYHESNEENSENNFDRCGFAYRNQRIILCGNALSVRIFGSMGQKKEMNNSIVNAGYPGWHEVTLDDHLQIKLPEAWTLVPGERITVTDENGEPVLAGVKIRSGSKESEQLTLGLLSECSGKRVSSYRMELAGYNMYLNFCETMWMWLDEQEKVTSVTVMHLDAELENIYYYFFCFHDTTGAYLTEAEAIAWSAKDR